MRRIVAAIVFALTPCIPAAQDGPAQPPTSNTIRLPPGAPRPAARIGDLRWLVGTWTGDGLGETIDEVWSEPAGGAMVQIGSTRFWLSAIARREACARRSSCIAG
jgi:hypothetical protein